MPRSKRKNVSKSVPVKDPPSADRLRLLPAEIRSTIYDFVSEPLTIQVRREWRGRETEHSPLLSLPWSEEYHRFCDTHRQKDSTWSPSAKKAFFKALEWTQDHGFTTRGILSLMSEIIYELSGEIQTKKQISILLTKVQEMQRNLRPKKSLATMRDNRLGETKRTVEKIQKDCQRLLSLSMAKSASAEALLQSIQDMASQLPAAGQADRKFSSLLDQPNPTLNGSVNIFRELSRMVIVSANGFGIYLDTLVPSFYFSLDSVSRFYRIDALPNLASSLIWDFGNDIEMLPKFNQRLSPDSQCYLRHVKITLVENFMLPRESQPLNSERGLCDYINTALPNLRILDIDLWPRDPTRADTGSREWGEQSKVLIDCLRYVKAKVRLNLRWAADCERFEREYVRKGGWRCIWRDNTDNQSEGNAGISHRCYELHGSGDKEVAHQ